MECKSCEEDWKDDFWCYMDNKICMNCCACAYGFSTPDKNGCKGISQPDRQPLVDEELPF